MSAVNEQEKAYLRELRRMTKARESFSHRRMCNAFGWSSVARSWQVMHALEQKGLLVKGRRLAYEDGPVIVLRAA